MENVLYDRLFMTGGLATSTQICNHVTIAKAARDVIAALENTNGLSMFRVDFAIFCTDKKLSLIFTIDDEFSIIQLANAMWCSVGMHIDLRLSRVQVTGIECVNEIHYHLGTSSSASNVI